MSASSVMSSGSVRKVENGANDDQEVEGVDIFGGDNDQTKNGGTENGEDKKEGDAADDSLFLVSQELREQEEKSRKENAKVEAKESKEDVDKIQVLTKEERLATFFFQIQ